MFGFTLEMDYTKPVEGFLNKLSFGGQMLLLGMLTVFSVLGLICLVLVIFKAVFAKLEKKKADTAAPAESVAPVTADTTDDGEIVAAIACALALAQSESENTKFRVVSFRRR